MPQKWFENVWPLRSLAVPVMCISNHVLEIGKFHFGSMEFCNASTRFREVQRVILCRD
jgi:hypothetical protein